VIVHINAQSFGSDLAGGDTVYRLRQRGVPVLVVNCNGDLKEALEKEVL
jgi:hypothetical protein